MTVRLPIHADATAAAHLPVHGECAAVGGSADPECLVIGYNETPFPAYEAFVRTYGENSEAYRDLRFSCVDIGARKVDYIGLLGHVFERAERSLGACLPWTPVEAFDIPNLAAVYLVQYLRRRGRRATYVNRFARERERLEALLVQDPACVAVTTTFYVTNGPVREVAEFVKARNPRVKVVVGGPLVANYARTLRDGELASALRDMGGDIFVIDSQGEETLVRVVSALRAGEPLERVPNLAFFEGPRLIRTPRLPENSSLDDNVIDWRAFSRERLGHTLQLRTARSCAFACAFCNYPTRAGALAVTSVEKVEQELDSIREIGTVRNVVFVDDTFNVPVRRFKELCRMMIRKRYPFSWYSYFRCSHADDEALELMAESGCRGVFLGIESGSPTVLTAMNKRATPEAYLRGIEALRGHGVVTFASFILGFPGETDATVAETAAFIRAARPDFYRAQLWYNEPGTPIHARAAEYEISGTGFVWKHRSMDSLRAMEHIERLFLATEDSIWLPQFSFDFWIIPYLLGQGLPLELFTQLMRRAQRLMALGIADVRGNRRTQLARGTLEGMVSDVVGYVRTNASQGAVVHA